MHLGELLGLVIGIAALVAIVGLYVKVSALSALVRRLVAEATVRERSAWIERQEAAIKEQAAAREIAAVIRDLRDFRAELKADRIAGRISAVVERREARSRTNEVSQVAALANDDDASDERTMVQSRPAMTPPPPSHARPTVLYGSR